MNKRVFLIVLDSVGIGEAPDAGEFGDLGANTLRRISESKNFDIPNLISLGIGNIDGVDYLEKCAAPKASYARMRELSRGKDTTIGHWEISGLISENPLPTYPDGFPASVIGQFESAVGRKVLCNLPYSGTDVIRDYGDEHVKTGALIVYTSADSVFQIAAHEDVVPPEKLYEYCRIARGILVGEHAVGRVIARPFVGESGNYKRTANRHDFSLVPARETALDAIKSAGLDVIAVGKITDIFAAKGITETVYTHGNGEGMDVAMGLLDRDFNGLAFINLVDFDMTYGHRQDVDGYAAALTEFDRRLGAFIQGMRDDDVLMITADHGCDPGDESTDHTREYTPLLIYSKGIAPKSLGTVDGFTSIGATAAQTLGVPYFGDSGKNLLG